MGRPVRVRPADPACVPQRQPGVLRLRAGHRRAGDGRDAHLPDDERHRHAAPGRPRRQRRPARVGLLQQSGAGDSIYQSFSSLSSITLVGLFLLQMPVVLIPIHFDRDSSQRLPSCQRSIVLRPFVSSDFMTGVPGQPDVHLPHQVGSEFVFIYLFFSPDFAVALLYSNGFYRVLVAFNPFRLVLPSSASLHVNLPNSTRFFPDLPSFT